MQARHPDHPGLEKGAKASLPFAPHDYQDRQDGLRDIMDLHALDALVLTSPESVAYATGFLCSRFGPPSACVVTRGDCTLVSPAMDAGRAWRRSVGEVISYCDWTPDAIWQAVASVIGTGKAIGCEADHLTLVGAEKLNTFVKPKRGMDIAPATRQQRMVKSPAELDLIRQGARVADIGCRAIGAAIRPGATERDSSMAGRSAMEQDIARCFPDAEYGDTWASVQSSLNTDGAPGSVTERKLLRGDILSIGCFPTLAGYRTGVMRTAFLGEPDHASSAVWHQTIAAQDHALGLLRPGASCAEIATKVTEFLAERDLLAYRRGSYGSGLGILSPGFGREDALELREDNDTLLEAGMVVTLSIRLRVPTGQPGTGGYVEQDICIIGEDGAERITQAPRGPDVEMPA